MNDGLLVVVVVVVRIGSRRVMMMVRDRGEWKMAGFRLGEIPLPHDGWCSLHSLVRFIRFIRCLHMLAPLHLLIMGSRWRHLVVVVVLGVWMTDCVSAVASSASDDTVAVGVVEFTAQPWPKISMTRKEAQMLMLDNMERMRAFLGGAARLVVFPEYGMLFWRREDAGSSTHAPRRRAQVWRCPTPISPRIRFLLNGPLRERDEGAHHLTMSIIQDRLNPCQQRQLYRESPVLIKGSCLAKTYKQVLVFHMGSIVWCNQTTSNDTNCPADGMASALTWCTTRDANARPPQQVDIS